MSNLHVSWYKLLMLLIVALSIFYSCTADEELFLEAVNPVGIEESNTLDKGPSGSSPAPLLLNPTDNTEVSDNPPDSTEVSEHPINIPIALATPSSGVSPLEVTFSVSNTLSDKTFAKYEWKFKDGTKTSSSKAVHTFKEVGEHEVELTATDQEGQILIDSVTVTVIESENRLPIAAASASVLTGEAPLRVDFTGGGSSDDKGVVSYYWNFPGNASSGPNTTYTFNDPGVYDLTLTVTDAEGLTDTAALTVTVDRGSPGNTAGGNIPCGTGGGLANATGEKVWCWRDVDVPGYSGNTGVSFSNKELSFASECNEQQVSKVGDRLRFNVNPTSPAPGNWCSRDYNMRAEIYVNPWSVKHPLGTEEWFGWDYTFGDDYVIDQNNEWLFFQVHNGVWDKSPQIELMVSAAYQYERRAGEIYVMNNAKGQERKATGIVPRAGQTLKIVVHAIWGNSSNGLLQVWIDGKSVYDKQVTTVYADSPWGGNPKWGIYKWPWIEKQGVQKSHDQGITHIQTYMGPLRMITRLPGDPDYRKNSYARVAPD